MEKLWGKPKFLEYYQKVRQAVEETNGTVMEWEGEYIEPLFHRCSGGWTREGDQGHPYLASVDSQEDLESDGYLTVVTWTAGEFTERIRQILSFMPYAEILFISAKTGQRTQKLFDMIDVVLENNAMRVATGVLNEIMTEAVAMQQPPSDKGKRLKLYYITQVAVKPPTFVIFVNDKELMHFSYTRYLENRIRDAFGFRGTALKFIIRERKGD